MSDSEVAGGGIAVQARLMHALLVLAEDLGAETRESELLETCARHLRQSLGLRAVVVYLCEPGQELATAFVDGDPTPAEAPMREMAPTAAETGRALVVKDADGAWSAVAPIRARHSTLGVVGLQGRVDEPPPDLDFLEIVGRQVGGGLDAARIRRELEATILRTQILNRIADTLSSSMDLKTVIPGFAAEIAQLLSFDRLACAFVNDSGDYIEVAGFPDDATWGLGSVIPVVGSGPGSVVLNDRAVLQRDLLHNHRFIEDMRLLEEGIRSYILLPLNSRGRSIGVLALGSAQSDAYDESTLARMQPLADAVALAFENVRLFQKTRDLSITDDLTPLYNLRFFHQILDRELKLVDRYRSVLSLIFIDLDRFKPINDQYGHLRGSRTLREVGFLLRTAVRETDYPARYGGDEFCVILPQTDFEPARALADKLRKLVEDHVFLQEEEINARIGASLGVATYPTEAASKEALIRLADERMYKDKETRKAGR